jgi:hypothetical protein
MYHSTPGLSVIERQNAPLQTPGDWYIIAERTVLAPHDGNLLVRILTTVRIHSSPPGPVARTAGASTRICSPAPPTHQRIIRTNVTTNIHISHSNMYVTAHIRMSPLIYIFQHLLMHGSSPPGPAARRGGASTRKCSPAKKNTSLRERLL